MKNTWVVPAAASARANHSPPGSGSRALIGDSPPDPLTVASWASSLRLAYHSPRPPHGRNLGGNPMAKAPPSARRDRLKPVVPQLVDYTSSVIYGDVWERPGLSKRDRSLVTVAALVASYRPEQLRIHLARALDNGLSKEELGEV